jgi:uncharacterized membrane protein
MIENLKKNLASLVILVAMVGISVYFAGSLPDSVATKFDFQGNPTQYANKWFAVSFLPALYLLLIATLPAFLKLSPSSYKFHSTQLLPRTLTATGLLLICMHYGLLSHEFRADGLALWFSLGLGLFMIALGTALEDSERNFFIGIRTPWSLATDANWKATHKFAAKIMALTGVLIILMCLIARPSFVITIGSMLFAMIIPVFYSLWYYQNMEKKLEKKP